MNDATNESKMMDLEHVTLYRNDFAYYEHKGSGRTLNVRVPKAEKALAMDTFSVQQCPPGTTAMVVDYTEETLEQQEPRLYAFDMGSGKPLGDFLSSCIGTAVSLDLGDGTVCRGHLMSVEKTQQALLPGSNGEHIEKKSTTIQVYEQGGYVRTIREVTDIRIEDEYLQSQLALALRASLQKAKPVPPGTSDKETIRVSLYDSPTGQRKETDKDAKEIRVSYVGKSEEWKCSYRMEVPKDDENGKAEDAPVMLEYVDLQLLGKVRNDSNDDWNNVKLSLVANELELMATKQSLVKPTSSVRGGKAAHTPGGLTIFVKTLTGKVRIDE
jgi:hypothetical protein